jgi:hypothetical protein
MADNAINCVNNEGFNVNFNGNTPTIGQIWSTWGSPSDPNAQRICVEIIDLGNESSKPYLISAYTDCYECLANNYYVVDVIDCSTGSIYNIPISEFGFIPTGKTYYFEITNTGSRPPSNQYFSCFTIESIYSISKFDFEQNILDDNFQLINGTPSETSYEECGPCLANNSLTYRVTRCTDNIDDYVPLINNTFIDHIISYSDGINQYCGQVGDLNPQTTSFVFINDYGLADYAGGIATCDDCLSTENQKILLQSCTDSEVTQVVWASALFNAGDISNLSTDDGCFIISGLTEDNVTINNYLNFDPQPGCEPCIECNGINYAYITCSGEYSGDFKSYQYLPSGTKFFHPRIGTCCEITGTASGYYNTLYSVETFTDCTDCENNSDINYWVVSACTNSNTYSSFYVTTDSTAQIGDTVKLMWGSNEWICATITETFGPSPSTYYNTQKESGVTKKYNSCVECNSEGLIGVTLVSCDSGVESFVSITLDNYLSIYNFGSLTNYGVKGSDGNCYQISNVCPIPLDEQGFTPVEFYVNCNFCTNTPDPSRSANTETLVCAICCDCGATGSTITQVSPPHPQWTDGYGTQVTQLNMITLGGMNGLNS